MTLGEKIRNLRRDAGLTQTALAGDHITRNMLSQIENGSASPSLQTIYYIADKLGVSAGYLIADGEDEATLKREHRLVLIRRAFSDGDYEECIRCAEGLPAEGDDELCLLLAEAYYRLALDNYRRGHLGTAQKEFLASAKYNSETLYSDDTIAASVSVIMRFMHEADTNLPREDEAELPKIKSETRPDMHIYERTLAFMNSGHMLETEAIINAKLLVSDIYNNHITAKLMMARGDYSVARILLESTIAKYPPTEIGAVMLLRLYSELEVCHTHEGNFEGAYNCASKKLEIIAGFHN